VIGDLRRFSAHPIRALRDCSRAVRSGINKVLTKH
jgi:hypothetical protein